MRVTFTKVDGKRYSVAIEREQGPALVPRFAPGFDDLMPHDIAHYLVEEQFQIQLGVWGQLAAGGGGIFTPIPSDNTLRHQRRVQRVAAMGRQDMARSEQLVSITVAAWELSIDRVKHQTRPFALQVEPEMLRATVRRLGSVADQWHALPYGGSLTFDWPRALTIDVSKTHRGRERERASRRVVTKQAPAARRR